MNILDKEITIINSKIERVMDEIESLESFLDSYKESGKSTQSLEHNIGLKYMGLQSLLNQKDKILAEKNNIEQMISEEQELFKGFSETFNKPFQNLTPKDIVDIISGIGRGFDPDKIIAKEKFDKIMSKEDELPEVNEPNYNDREYSLRELLNNIFQAETIDPDLLKVLNERINTARENIKFKGAEEQVEVPVISFETILNHIDSFDLEKKSSEFINKINDTKNSFMEKANEVIDSVKDSLDEKENIEFCPVCSDYEEKLVVNLQNSLRDYLLFQLEKEKAEMIELVELKISKKREKILSEISKGIKISLD